MAPDPVVGMSMVVGIHLNGFENTNTRERQVLNPRAGASAESGSDDLLLAIDTSTDQVGIATFDGSGFHEHLWLAGREGTTQVLPAIESMLDFSQHDIASVGAVAVAIGPGTFTGLRVGLSVAKGLALAAPRALIGIPTLELLAAPYRDLRQPVTIAIAAGRDRVVWSALDEHARLGPPVNSSLDDVVLALRDSSPAFVIADLDGTAIARIAEVAAVVSGAAARRRPGVLAELGWARWRAGETDDPTSLQPVYLHGRRS